MVVFTYISLLKPFASFGAKLYYKTKQLVHIKEDGVFLMKQCSTAVNYFSNKESADIFSNGQKARD